MNQYIMLLLAVFAIANAQYFSSNDGINLPRNGKRSSFGNYLHLKGPLRQSRLYEQPERFFQTDKLSFRKAFGKYGRDLLSENEATADLDAYLQELNNNPGVGNAVVKEVLVEYLTNNNNQEQTNVNGKAQEQESQK